MSELVIRIEGQAWVTIETICECYDCDIAWVREACEFGLLGTARPHAGTVVFRATVLDRVARVVRLSRYERLGFEAIVVLLGDADDEAVDADD
jgi:hypothetical protein